MLDTGDAAAATRPAGPRRVLAYASAPVAAGRRPGRWPWLAVTAVVVAGIVLRSHTASPLWLDEAQAVAIARRPVPQLLGALRHDGSPPLYYLLLHYWMAIFGSGTNAVRALSGIFSVASLPVAYLLTSRLAGRAAGWTAVVLFAVSPYAVSYASWARMYSMVTLLSLLLGLAVHTTVLRPTRRSAAGVALSTAALLYSHYWTAFLLAVAVALLAGVAAYRPAWRRSALAALAGIGAGALAIAPWIPSLLFQLRHTGTPWAPPAPAQAVAWSVAWWAGGVHGWIARTLAVALLLTAAAGFLLERGPSGRVVVRPLGTATGWLLSLASAGTLVLSIAVAHLLGSGYQPRYTAAAFPYFVILAAVGCRQLPGRWRSGAVAAVTILGLVVAAPQFDDTTRSQAGQVAAVLASNARPGDVVAYCPDQLGPAVTRLAPPGLTEVGYPRGTNPAMVDWVNYTAQNRPDTPTVFARRLLSRAHGRAVYLVWQDGYRTFGDSCERLRAQLALGRPHPQPLLRYQERYYEHESVVRFPP